MDLTILSFNCLILDTKMEMNKNDELKDPNTI